MKTHNNTDHVSHNETHNSPTWDSTLKDARNRLRQARRTVKDLERVVRFCAKKIKEKAAFPGQSEGDRC